MRATDDPTFVAQYDQVSAVLRDAEQPMTAKEIGKHMAALVGKPCLGGEHKPLQWETAVVCEGSFDVILWGHVLGGNIKDVLETLHAESRVTREKVGRSVYWSHVPSEASGDDVVALADLWIDLKRSMS